MSKVKDLFPDMPEFSKATEKLNEITNFVNITKAINETSQSPTVGSDVTLNWGTYGVYQGPQRVQTLREFIRLSVRVAEIRAPVQHVTSEVFRRGIQWIPRFVVKCDSCKTEYNETKEICPNCGSNNLVKPDEKQKKKFSLFLSEANSFNSSLEEVLKAFNTNLAVLDDAILYLMKEYIGDDITGGVHSKVLEIRNISPSDIDFDLDKKGIPKNNHFLCYLHREESLSSVPGVCPICERNLIPVMFILHHQGKDIYLTDSEVIHSSRYIPSDTWGTCFSSDSEILTRNGIKNVKDITYEDEIATLNPGTNEIIYQNPQHVIKMPHNGDMVRVKSQNVDLLVTPEHKNYVKHADKWGKVKDKEFSLVKAETLIGENAQYKRDAKWVGIDKEYFEIPALNENSYRYKKGINIPIKIWSEFLGYYLSSGRTYPQRGFTTLYVNKNSERYDLIKNCLNKMPGEWSFNGEEFACLNKSLSLFLSQNINKKENKLNINVIPSSKIHRNITSNIISKTLSNKRSKFGKYKYLSSFIFSDNRNDETQKFITIPERTIEWKLKSKSIKIPMDVWVEFLGYYLSEGCTSGKWRVCVAQKNGTWKDKKIKECLDKMPFKWAKYGDNVEYVTSSKELSSYLKQFGLCNNKFIPKEIKELSPKYLNILLNALMLGDGYKDITYYSTSKKLIDDVFEIALKCGFAPSVQLRKKRKSHWLDSWVVTIARKWLKQVVYNHDIEQNYNDFVYCVEVPDYHIIYAGRNGHLCWTGNSPIFTIMDKAMTLIGMDSNMYNYFWNRKMPASMILVFTDDPESVRRVQKEMESKTRQDTNYIPMVAVSSRNQRGRVDMVRLFHTLQEMEYLPVRQEIRERIAEIWGVTPMWQASSEAMGGLSSQSVTGDTPVWVRYDDKFIDVLPIESLHKVTNNKYELPNNIEILSANGWTKPHYLWKEPRNKDILIVQTYKGVVKVTPDHSLFQNKEKISPSNLKIGDFIDKTSVPENLNMDSLTNDQAWFLGFYAAEGSLGENDNRLEVSNNNEELLQKSKKIIEGYSQHKAIVWFNGKKNGRATICDTTFVKHIKNIAYHEYDVAEGNWKLHGRIKNHVLIKKVPMAILNGNKEIKKAYLEGYWAGDGHFSKDNRWTSKTVSWVLAAGLQYLGESLGYNVTFSFIKSKKEEWNDIFELRFNNGNKINNRKYLPNSIKKIENDTATNKWVYDFETEDHTFVGGLGFIILSNTQQLVVMSRVVEGYQRIYHEKVFPKILYAFGITDWLLELPQPEEKSEQTRIAFAQQRTAIATQLHNMGFDVEIRSSGDSVDDIDFVISGKATNQQQAMFGGDVSSVNSGNGEMSGTNPIALSRDVDNRQRGWINQIVSSGHVAPEIKFINNEGNRIYFIENGKDYVASFDNNSKLMKIEEMTMRKVSPIVKQVKPKYQPKRKEEIDEDE